MLTLCTLLKFKLLARKATSILRRQRLRIQKSWWTNHFYPLFVQFILLLMLFLLIFLAFNFMQVKFMFTCLKTRKVNIPLFQWQLSVNHSWNDIERAIHFASPLYSFRNYHYFSLLCRWMESQLHKMLPEVSSFWLFAIQNVQISSLDITWECHRNAEPPQIYWIICIWTRAIGTHAHIEGRIAPPLYTSLQNKNKKENKNKTKFQPIGIS